MKSDHKNYIRNEFKKKKTFNFAFISNAKFDYRNGPCYNIHTKYKIYITQCENIASRDSYTMRNMYYSTIGTLKFN